MLKKIISFFGEMFLVIKNGYSHETIFFLEKQIHHLVAIQNNFSTLYQDFESNMNWSPNWSS
jgi:hypothetical protein